MLASFQHVFEADFSEVIEFGLGEWPLPQRRAGIDQQKRGPVSLALVLTHIRRAKPGGRVPVDEFCSIPGQILSQFGDLEGRSEEATAVFTQARSYLLSAPPHVDVPGFSRLDAHHGWGTHLECLSEESIGDGHRCLLKSVFARNRPAHRCRLGGVGLPTVDAYLERGGDVGRWGESRLDRDIDGCRSLEVDTEGDGHLISGVDC